MKFARFGLIALKRSLELRGFTREFSRKSRHVSNRIAKNAHPVILPKFTTVSSLASLLKVRFNDLQKKMRELGFVNYDGDQIIDEVSAALIADELNVPAELSENTGKDIYPQPPADPSTSVPRPPVVALMGHVDHGKTTLLDYFRSSRIVDEEKGGITQRIGAFMATLKSGNQKVCFLDTPGHEAFLKLRQRGAFSTDIVLLVVATDDSVMPQTREAIKHAKAAKVPLLVALTKTDIAESNVAKTIADLAAAGVDVEEYGGDTQCVPVSVPAKKGLAELEAALVALTEILDLRAPTAGNVEGVVVESEQIKGLGNAATAIVRRGTLKQSQIFVSGTTFCKVRQMFDESGKTLREVLPGMPARITGWKELPEPGDNILEAENESLAKSVVDYRKRLILEAKEAKQIEQINKTRHQEHEMLEKRQRREERLNLGLEAEAIEPEKKSKDVLYIIKADVNGSAEALEDCVEKLGNKEVRASVLYRAVGQVSESDIFRAQTAGATIISFALPVARPISRLAEKNKVTIRRYDIIYKALEDVSADLSAKLEPLITQKVLASAEIREVFEVTLRKSKVLIAGIKVNKGSMSKQSRIRVLHNGKIVYDGKLVSIQHGREQVSEAHKNSEYGVGFDNWAGFEKGDTIEAYEEIIIPRHL